MAAVRETKQLLPSGEYEHRSAILISSTKAGSEPFIVDYQTRMFDLLSDIVVIVNPATETLTDAFSFPVTSRGKLAQLIADPEANKLIDGFNTDEYHNTNPEDVQATIRDYHLSLVERETSATNLSIALDRSVALLGNAVLHPMKFIEV